MSLDEFLEQLSRYEELALANLFNEALPLDDEEALDQRVALLRIHAVFPNLTEQERLLLPSLHTLRRGVIDGVNTDFHGLPPSINKHLDHSLSTMEGSYCDVKALVETFGILAKLSPLQQEYIKRELFRITFKLDEA